MDNEANEVTTLLPKSERIINYGCSTISSSVANLVWKNVNVVVKKTGRVIPSDANGLAKAGELIAIIAGR